jgi:periplasmic divalent cation tolerance protein
MTNKRPVRRTECVAVQTTVARQRDAALLAGALVDKRLAACVQVSSIRSVYRWKGRVQRAREWKLVFKTRRSLADKVIRSIRSLHPYELPEIVVTEISGGLPEYLSWICSETRVAGAGSGK